MQTILPRKKKKRENIILTEIKQIPDVTVEGG